MPEAEPERRSKSGNGNTPPPLTTVEICMGSSCFSRGNSRNIEVVQDFLKKQSRPPAVELRGHLCEGHCQAGPNVTINGKMYHEVDPIVIIGLLNHYSQQREG